MGSSHNHMDYSTTSSVWSDTTALLRSQPDNYPDPKLHNDGGMWYSLDAWTPDSGLSISTQTTDIISSTSGSEGWWSSTSDPPQPPITPLIIRQFDPHSLNSPTNDSIVVTHESDNRKARRRAQNRRAQRQYRQRKDSLLQDYVALSKKLETELKAYKTTTEQLRAQIRSMCEVCAQRQGLFTGRNTSPGSCAGRMSTNTHEWLSSQNATA